MIGDIPVKFGKSRLMTTSEELSAAETAGVQLNNHVSLHPENFFEGGDNRDGGHAKQIWDLQELSEQSTAGLSTLQQI